MLKTLKEYRLNCKLMGSAFELILVHNDEKEATVLLRRGVDEIKRIEALLSTFIEGSVISLINKNAGIKAITVSDEVFGLFKRSLQISDLTEGAFDISVGPLKQLYDFKNQTFEIPQKNNIQAALKKVGYKKIVLSSKNKTVFLKKKNMQISFAAIGKGYAADCVKKIWRQAGVHAGVINASGDLTTLGHRADGSHWKIGITSSDKKNILFYLPVENAAVATSGDEEQFFIHQNKKYSHNINPKTGHPLEGLKSITVFSPSAELSDALATAVYVMGIKKGLYFVDQLPSTHCIIIDSKNKVFFSKKLQLQYEK